MNETEIRALGFEPWYGGDEAPGDWDGSEVLFATGATCKDDNASAWYWRHNGASYNIIGYKKKETPMEYPEWVVSRAHELADNCPALCQMIMDHEQPPVDPDFELARKHYKMWADDDHDTTYDAILAAIKEARNA